MIFRKAVDNFLETELDGELVLMSTENGSFHALKDTGLAIWRLIDGQSDVTAIQKVLNSQYDVDPTTCRNKVGAFLKTLSDAGFVEEV